MGDHVSMDAYNYRFIKVTENVEKLRRCVDDSLIHAATLEEAFFHTAEYLSLLGQNGILQNSEKFQFGTKTVEWAGFSIGEHSVKPLPKHTAAIRTFPTPLNKVTCAGSWPCCRRWPTAMPPPLPLHHSNTCSNQLQFGTVQMILMKHLKR